MTTIKPVPAAAFTGVRDTDGTPGWLHDCGAFAYSPTQPHRCGVCWSAGRTAWAHNDSWQRAYVTKQVAS
ncbi:hypothetical protein [Kribbella sp. NBC_00889]|uniref:hypothetical protein n=1 Tax=Kribbella sp. NBC_00889 TaxID=2975974 RepID=UPI0038669554|nr:hypothetical protein OG817_01045 [Kribbella sp. NBC_00889]